MMAEPNELKKYVPAKILPGSDSPEEGNLDYEYILITDWNKLDELEKYKKFYKFYFIDHTYPKYKLQGPFDLNKTFTPFFISNADFMFILNKHKKYYLYNTNGMCYML